MSKQEDRERKTAEWLEHLESCRDSGMPLAAYARSHGLTLWSMYHWRNVLRREGRWTDDVGGKNQAKVSPLNKSRIPLRFARISLRAPMPRALTVRIQLRNGRSIEIELSDRGELAPVLVALEQST